MKKKKIVFTSDFSKSKTGFGKNARAILSYLHSTNKYEIVEYAMAPILWRDSNTEFMPWKCHGCLPENMEELKPYISDQNKIRAIQYGSYYIDKIVEQEKPDLLLLCQDFWAFSDYWNKPWWNKFACALWTTLDSIPILDAAIKNASKIKNYWVWADFARKALCNIGHDHVKTVHGVIDTTLFFRMPDEERLKIRDQFLIEKDTVIFGFVFRNQLRKLVGNLIEGFKLHKNENPNSKAKLLLHTFWEEGWKISNFIKENNLSNDDVLTTYICHSCRKIDVKPYEGQGCACRHCKQEACHNPKVDFGCTDEELNVIYNLMDAYVHPMTSGGLELPILEAATVGMPISTVPYSCGEEYTEFEIVHSMKCDFTREINSQFLKANPRPESIAEFISSIVNMDKKEIVEIGNSIRNYFVEKFDPQKTFDFIESFIDNIEFSDYDFNFEREERDEAYPIKNIEDNREWLKDLYKGCLKMDVSNDDSGLIHWSSCLEKGISRQQVYDFFIKTAKKENEAGKKVDLEKFFLQNGKKRLIYVMPKSIGDCFISTSILKSLEFSYPEKEWDLYVATEPNNFEMFKHISRIKNLIPYSPIMDNFKFLEGFGSENGYCDVALQPYLITQRLGNYPHNGLDKDELQVF